MLLLLFSFFKSGAKGTLISLVEMASFVTFYSQLLWLFILHTP